MQRCAQILNGVVENVVIADLAFQPGDGSILVQSDTAGIGWTYADGVFTAVVQPIVYQTTGLTFLQFMALFTSAEQTAVINSTDAQTRVFVMMAAGSGGLDLTNSEVINGVNYLASINLITTERAATILSGNPDGE